MTNKTSLGSARWHVLENPSNPTSVLAHGQAGKPEVGKYLGFSIDFRPIVGSTKQRPLSYWVRVVGYEEVRLGARPAEAAKSNLVRVNFTAPSGAVTDFSDLLDGGPEGRRFDNPLLNGRRVDWCREWATNCGAPAADLYCKKRGFYGAKSWAQAPNIGAQGQTTMCLGTGQLCQAPHCDGFSFISCSYHPRCSTTLYLLEQTLDRCGQVPGFL